MNDKNRKAMFAKKNNSSLSSKDIVSHQKKFGINTGGNIGLLQKKNHYLESDDKQKYFNGELMLINGKPIPIKRYVVSEKDIAELWEYHYESPNEDTDIVRANGHLSENDYKKYFDMTHGETLEWEEYPERVKKVLRDLVLDNIEQGRYDDYFDKQNPNKIAQKVWEHER